MRNLKITSILALLTSSHLAVAQDTASPVCRSNNICTIQRELIKDNGKKEIVPYSFKYRAPKNGAPTFVFIPGGPGGTSSQLDFDNEDIPRDFGIIFTDPMFVGVNKNKKMKQFSSATTSGQIAKDIASALKSVNAKDVIIHSVSYGTVVATILASDLSKQGQKPRTVILEGTLGKAQGPSEATANFSSEWNKIVETADPKAAQAFITIVDKLIQSKETSPEEVAALLQNFLMQRHFNVTYNAPILEEYFAKSLKMPWVTGDDLMKLIIKQRQKSVTPEEEWVHGTIACKETAPGSNADVEAMAFNGKLVLAKASNDCGKYVAHKDIKPYDSKNYQIDAPVIYLQGENDPATPPSQAMYHAKNQTNMNRKMILMKNAGHLVLNKRLGNCKEDFLSALQTNPDTATKALDPCLKALQASSPQSSTSSTAPAGLK